MALAAMILGIAGLVLCFLGLPALLALILGLVAASQIKRSDGAQTGLGMARAGWIMGVVGLAVFGLFVGLAVSGVFDDEDTGVFDLEVGDCVLLEGNLFGGDSVNTLPVVDCDEPHDGEVFETGELNPDRDLEYPSDAVLFEMIAERCEAVTPGSPILEYLGVEPTELGDWVSYRIAPDEQSWVPTRGAFVCIVGPADESQLVDGTVRADG